jgi:hypothetical protein
MLRELKYSEMELLKESKLWCGSEDYEVVVKWNECKVMVKCKCNSTCQYVFHYCCCLVYNINFIAISAY